ncbi:hypothetical protein ACJX0J_008485, partial [Zea mays]
TVTCNGGNNMLYAYNNIALDLTNTLVSNYVYPTSCIHVTISLLLDPRLDKWHDHQIMVDTCITLRKNMTDTTNASSIIIISGFIVFSRLCIINPIQLHALEVEGLFIYERQMHVIMQSKTQGMHRMIRTRERAFWILMQTNIYRYLLDLCVLMKI